MKFKQYNFQSFLIEALNKQRIFEPTDIQSRLIPSILQGRSVIGRSHTGTGKTLTYLLPILEQIDPSQEHCQAIITAPTRELARQIYAEAQKLIAKIENIRIRPIVGGTERKRLLEQLKTPPHIVIGTPGRISSFIKEGELQVYRATKLVIDEADLMFEMGFITDVDMIASRMATDLQMLVFSATIPEHLQPFLRKYMERPKFVEIDDDGMTTSDVSHRLIPLRHRDLGDLIITICQTFTPYLAMIFANTKAKVDEIYTTMSNARFKVERLHGGLSPRERKQVMRRIERLECEFIVATDLASRGIDIPGISHIINAEIPEDLDFFIHRVGRTGRAGISGETFTIYKLEEARKIAALEKRKMMFQHVDIKDGRFVEMPPRKKRRTVKREPSLVLPKPKKVTPGYKKKLRAKQAKLMRKRK